MRLVLTAVTAGLAMLAVSFSLLAFRYQNRLIETSRYNSTFDMTQVSAELLRLIVALYDGVGNNDIDQIALRYNILQSRIKVMVSTPPLGVMPSDMIVLQKLEQDVRGMQTLMVPPVNRQSTLNAINALKTSVSPTQRLAALAHSRAGDRVMSMQSDLKLVSAGLYLILLALVLFGALLIVFAFRQIGHLDKAISTDTLTGIGNRLSFHEALLRSAHMECAIVILDVNQFKVLNDTLGHDRGDRVLVVVSKRLRDVASNADHIARIGGDEFAVLYAGANAMVRAASFCKGIKTAMLEPVMIDAQNMTIGVALGCSSGILTSATTLFKDADIALQHDKSKRHGNFTLFHPDMKLDLMRSQRLEQDLQVAVERQEMYLLFQPIIDLVTSRTMGFEALLRWNHPEFGLVSPAEFIPLAEGSGHIRMIGEWVIAEACRQAKLWPGEAFVAVNVSAKQLADPGLVAHVRECLEDNGLDAKRLEIEITETTLIENDTAALSVLRDLRALGCVISLDDFGTGYASLSYLHRFPFDKIKIDQSFVQSDNESHDNIAIIETICTLANRLGLEIVAEGIELEHQRHVVREAGCDLGQGYLFDRPLKPEALLARLKGEVLA